MRFTTARTAPGKGTLRGNGLLQALILWYAIVWSSLAVTPVDRSDWVLENLLAVALVLGLILTFRNFQLSDLSYLLLTMFLTMHAVGAHYTYAKVPLGFWVQDAFGLTRNHFDRLVHFSFGLLIFYPIRELMIRRSGVREPWSYLVTITTIQGCSDLFEIIEAVIAHIVAPDLGNAYLGTQGDEWDAQKDMAAAFTGAVIAALVTYVVKRSCSRGFSPKLKAAA